MRTRSTAAPSTSIPSGTRITPTQKLPSRAARKNAAYAPTAKNAPCEKLMISRNPKIRLRPSASRTRMAPLTRPVKIWVSRSCIRRARGSARDSLGGARRQVALAGRERLHDLAVAELRRPTLAGRLRLTESERGPGRQDRLAVALANRHVAAGQAQRLPRQVLDELVRLVLVGLDGFRVHHDGVVDICGVAARRGLVLRLVVLDELLDAGIAVRPHEVLQRVRALERLEPHLLVERLVREVREDLHLPVQA